MDATRPSPPGVVKERPAPFADPAGCLRRAFAAALEAAAPSRLLVPELLPRDVEGRLVVVGAGKAAAGMACAVVDGYSRAEDRAVTPEGLVIVPHGAPIPCRPDDIPDTSSPGAVSEAIGRIAIRRGAHPIPNDASVAATVELLACAAGLSEEDTLVALWSGGGSSLFCQPRGVSLAEKQAVVSQLLQSGATIHEINLVRRHLSGVKGGQFVRVTGAGRIFSYVISDVVGDDLPVIASGPTVPDPTTFAEALAVLDRYRLAAPEVRAALRHGVRGRSPETPKPGDKTFRRVRTRIIGTGRDALKGASDSLSSDGLAVLAMDPRVEGAATAAARRDAQRARRLAPGEAFLTNGECTVEVKGKGRGGRNLEYLLALAIELDGAPGVWALAADTDGTDGTSDAAGAVIGPETLARARASGLDPAAFLADNDAHGLFDALGDLVRTGWTGTNVNDLHVILKVT